MKKIIVAGHVAVDMTPSFTKKFNEKTLSDILKPGKLIDVGKANFSPGGCVTNTGLALNFFGADVILVAKIGRDNFGKMIVDSYRAHGVEPRFIVAEEESTSYTIVIAPPGCDRIFFHDTAANHTFSETDINDDLLQEAEYFHFGYPTLMRRFYQNDGAELTTLFKRAKEHHLITSMDMAAIDSEGEAAQADWTKILKDTLPYVDFFVPSVEELCFMLDRKAYNEWQRRAGNQDICRTLSVSRDIKPLAQKTLELGCRALLLKCGAPGIYLQTSDEVTMCSASPYFNGRGWGNFSKFETSFLPYRVRSGTGAGDTSIAAFLYGVSNGYSPEESLAIAVGTGTCCITEYDSLSGLLPIDKLREKIASGWEKEFQEIP